MNPLRKKPGDSVLKNLPEAHQVRLYEFACCHTLAQTEDWLLNESGWGLTHRGTGIDKLSRWRRWYHRQEEHKINSEVVAGILTDLKREKPELTDAQLEAYGNRAFSLLALRREDGQAWARVRNVALKVRQVGAEERRVTVLEKKADQADKAKGVLEDKALSEEQRASRLREVFGVS